MPKRNNPFGDHSSLQLKTHVGTKQVDKGVDQVSRMQSVYDKTHDLLFSGMKSFMNQTEKNNNDYFTEVDPNNGIGTGPAFTKRDNLRQMHLGSNCQLVSEDVDMEVNCMSGDNCPADFIFGRTPSEHSPPGFVSAASLMTSPQKSMATVSGSNIFERMKAAQMKMSTESKMLGGACHSCTRPVHTRDVLKCQFCENYVCSSCTRQCSGCFLHFCQLCSVLNYNQITERAFCLACNNK